jgi:hypothetical protein
VCVLQFSGCHVVRHAILSVPASCGHDTCSEPEVTVVWHFRDIYLSKCKCGTLDTSLL